MTPQFKYIALPAIALLLWPLFARAEYNITLIGDSLLAQDQTIAFELMVAGHTVHDNTRSGVTAKHGQATGIGKSTRFVKRIWSEKNVAVIMLGTNDWIAGATFEAYAGYMDAIFNDIDGSTRIICLGQPDHDYQGEVFNVFPYWYLRLTAAMFAEAGRCEFLDLTPHFPVNAPGLIEADGLHFTEAGRLLVADLIQNALEI